MELKGRDAEIAKKDTDIAKKDEKLKSKDLDIARKDKQIAYMKSVVKQQRGQIRQLESILDPVDLTTEDESAESPNKRARTGEDPPKSTLAVQHEQIKKVVKVKEENINEYVDFLWAKLPRLRAAFVSFDEFVSATAMANMG